MILTFPRSLWKSIRVIAWGSKYPFSRTFQISEKAKPFDKTDISMFPSLRECWNLAWRSCKGLSRNPVNRTWKRFARIGQTLMHTIMSELFSNDRIRSRGVMLKCQNSSRCHIFCDREGRISGWVFDLLSWKTEETQNMSGSNKNRWGGGRRLLVLLRFLLRCCVIRGKCQNIIVRCKNMRGGELCRASGTLSIPEKEQSYSKLENYQALALVNISNG